MPDAAEVIKYLLGGIVALIAILWGIVTSRLSRNEDHTETLKDDFEKFKTNIEIKNQVQQKEIDTININLREIKADLKAISKDLKEDFDILKSEVISNIGRVISIFNERDRNDK